MAGDVRCSRFLFLMMLSTLSCTGMVQKERGSLDVSSATHWLVGTAAPLPNWFRHGYLQK